MASETLVKYLLGGMGLLILFVKFLLDFIKARKASEDQKKILTEERAKELFLTKEECESLLSTKIRPLLTKEQADHLLAVQAREQHEGMFAKVPCHGQKRDCTERMKEDLKDISRAVTKLCAARDTGQHDVVKR